MFLLNFRISEKFIGEARIELLQKSKNGEFDIAESDLTVLKCLLQDNRLTNQTITDVMAAFLFAGVEQVNKLYLSLSLKKFARIFMFRS